MAATYQMTAETVIIIYVKKIIRIFSILDVAKLRRFGILANYPNCISIATLIM